MLSTACFLILLGTRAIAVFLATSRLDPSLALAFYHRGLPFTRRGQAARGKADQEKAVKLDTALSGLSLTLPSS